MSLRARLLITTLVLVAAGLLVANFVTHRFLSTFLVKRLDEQLVSAQPFAARALSITPRVRRRGITRLDHPSTGNLCGGS